MQPITVICPNCSNLFGLDCRALDEKGREQKPTLVVKAVELFVRVTVYCPHCGHEEDIPT